MATRLEGSNQLNEIIFQDDIDSYPLRDNFEKVTQATADHAASIEALESGGSPPASSSAEVIAAREEATDLKTRIVDSQKDVYYGIFAGVSNECKTIASGTPDDKVEVGTGQGFVNGSLFRETGAQVVDPSDFALGITNPRIDVVHISADGSVAVTTGLPAVNPIPEEIPSNTLEIAKLWLEPSGGNPNVPNPIRDFSNGTDSFIILKNDRFLYLERGERPEATQINTIKNPAFLNDTSDWSGTNATITTVTTPVKYGNASLEITNDGSSNLHYVSQVIDNPTTYHNKQITITAFIRLSAAGNITAAMELIQTGAAPAVSTFVEAIANEKDWIRLVLQAYVDNDVTALELRIFPDTRTVKTSSIVAFIDGIQLVRGLEVRGFQYPTLITIDDDGTAEGVNAVPDLFAWINL